MRKPGSSTRLGDSRLITQRHADSEETYGSGRRRGLRRLPWVEKGQITCYVTTIPVGVAPAGPAVENSGVGLPPPTENPLTVSWVASTTHKVAPSGESRASTAPSPLPPTGMSWSQVSAPLSATEKLEITDEPVSTLKR